MSQGPLNPKKVIIGVLCSPPLMDRQTNITESENKGHSFRGQPIIKGRSNIHDMRHKNEGFFYIKG